MCVGAPGRWYVPDVGDFPNFGLFAAQFPDSDPGETEEWLDSIDAFVSHHGEERTRALLARVLQRAADRGVAVPAVPATPFVNTVPAGCEPAYPGDMEAEERIRAFVQWNAVATVVRANKRFDGIGGHLSTFASAAVLVDVGMNHFFRGKASGLPGDHVFFQGHASPGVYARAFLEGRLSEDDLDLFRREAGGQGLSSYPHPRLMPAFWEFPTVSMGLGPLNAVYQARLVRHLANRGVDDEHGSRVWCFVGDGEMDEPESVAGLTLAAREGLDNLTFVVNCNTQRLDGPVRGNGKVMQEFERVFAGAGWNVVKVVWGGAWDALLARDTTGALAARMDSVLDGDLQRMEAGGPAAFRDEFFSGSPELVEMGRALSDADVDALLRGGHDPVKVHAAYRRAVETKGVPTVVLAATVKGWGLGEMVEARNATHQVKKMTESQMKALRGRLGLAGAVPDSAFVDGLPPYARLPEADARYLAERREALGGPLPSRPAVLRKPLPSVGGAAFDGFDAGSGAKDAATTAALTRVLRDLMRDPDAGGRVVPILSDEGRTFGMDAYFPEFGIYAPGGQKYEPVDSGVMLSYTERNDGQVLQEGITEAGCLASWTAAATSYATRGVSLLPFFTFYSMFGFQRVGDAIWAAADARARGFLVGATAGRTTLAGEGLQHADGHSHLAAMAVPSCMAYDPAFAYEVAAVVKDGVRRMHVDGDDVFYYLTVYNEAFSQPARPEGVTDLDIARGMYRFSAGPGGKRRRANILFSGSAQAAAREAQQVLADDHDVSADLWSVTSWKLLHEDGRACDTARLTGDRGASRLPLVTGLLRDPTVPSVAVTDWVRAVADVGRWVPGGLTVLGTDGFGLSDTREEMRRHFGVDAGSVVNAVLRSLG